MVSAIHKGRGTGQPGGIMRLLNLWTGCGGGQGDEDGVGI